MEPLTGILVGVDLYLQIWIRTIPSVLLKTRPLKRNLLSVENDLWEFRGLERVIRSNSS